MNLNSRHIISCNSVSVAGLIDIFPFEYVGQHHEGSFDDICFAGALKAFPNWLGNFSAM